MTPPDTLTPKTDTAFGFDNAAGEQVLAGVKDLRPLIESKAAEQEANGELSVEVVEALDAVGAFRLAGPLRVGGLAQSSQMMAEVAAELAKACPSTAWVYTIYNSCLWFASKLPAVTQARVFDGGVPRFCSPRTGSVTWSPTATASGSPAAGCTRPARTTRSSR